MISKENFLIFYQKPIWELGLGEDISFLSGFFNNENITSIKNWGKNILEAAWRLKKSNIAIIDSPIEIDNIFCHFSSCPQEKLNHDWGFCFLDPTQLAVDLREKYQLTEFEDFNPEFFKALSDIFDRAGVGFDVPYPYLTNWQDKDIDAYPWNEL